MADADPPPIPTVIVAGLLRLIAAGLEPIEATGDDSGATSSVLTVSGWWLLLGLDDQGTPAELFHAQPPTPLRPPWTWGCQRDDWTLGPDSRVVTPMELLTVEQRQRLGQVLEAAPAARQWVPLLGFEVDDDEWFMD